MYKSVGNGLCDERDDAMNNSEYPKRCHPAHPAPVERWNHPIVLMITVGLRKPNRYHCLDDQMFHNTLLGAWLHAPEWRPGYYMIMPDHLHFFCVPGRSEFLGVCDWCRKWKSLVTRSLSRPDWRWLPGCWDTQMRGYDHYVEKRAYVEMNPVRKNFAIISEAWPYQGEINQITW